MRAFAGLLAIVALATISIATHHAPRADPPECPVPAPGERLNITFYPNEDDCTMYWECDQGNLYNGTCPDGLIWNPEHDACDWSYNYDCPYDKRKVATFPGVPDSLADPPECPVPAPGERLNITFYPNEDDCTMYWECDQGNLYNGTCPDGLIWNPEHDACDWSYNYDCPYDKRKIATFPGVPGSLAEIVCPPPSADGSYNVTFHPNDEDCHKFWECDNGELIEGSCDAGLVWNPIINTCDWDYNYPCQNSQPVETPEFRPLPVIRFPQRP